MKSLVSSFQFLTVVALGAVMCADCTAKSTASAADGATDSLAADSAAAVEEAAVVEPLFSIDDFIELLKHEGGEEYAKKCGMSLIYSESFQQSEEDEVGLDEAVYGRDIKKGDKLEYGYQLINTSAHACYFNMMLDTSTHAVLAFKSKEDADCFWEHFKKWGVLDLNGDFVVPDKKLPAGDPIKIETMSDYNGLFGVEPPVLNDGYYEIIINWFS